MNRLAEEAASKRHRIYPEDSKSIKEAFEYYKNEYLDGFDAGFQAAVEVMEKEVTEAWDNYAGSEIDRKYFEHELVPQLEKRIVELEKCPVTINESYTLNNHPHDQIMIKLLESKLQIAIEALLRIQVRIDETNHHKEDLSASRKYTKEALAKIKGES